MTQEKRELTFELGEKEIARMKSQSVSANLQEGTDALAAFNEVLGNVYRDENGILNFDKDKDGNEASATDVKEQLAKLRAYAETALTISNDKQSSKDHLDFGATQVPAVEDAQAAAAGIPRRDGSFSNFLKQFYNQKVPTPREAMVHNGGRFEVEDFSMSSMLKFANAMRESAGGSAGISEDSPRSLEPVVRALELRGGLLGSLSEYPMPNQGSAYVYLAQAETGIVQPSGVGVAEAADSAQYDPFAGVRSQSVVECSVMGSITKTQLEDVPQAGDYWYAELMRLLLEYIERGIIQGNGNADGSATGNATANAIAGLIGSGTGNTRIGQAGLTDARTDTAADKPLSTYLISALKIYIASRASGGAGTRPTHLVLPQASAVELLSEKASDGHYLYPQSPPGLGVAQFMGVNVLGSDYMTTDTGMFFNNDPMNVGVIWGRGITVDYGLDGNDLKKRQQSANINARFNVVVKHPKTVMEMTNIDGSS